MEQNKRRKIRRQKTIFTNVEDERECLQIMLALDEALNLSKINMKITWSLLKEISEYSTGNLIKCKGELDHEECTGFIHFLHGDNFNKNCDNVSYAWNLFKYQCDDYECYRISHVLTCNDDNCDKIIQIKEDESPYPSMVCENALRLKPSCREIHCIQHFEENGISCAACSNYFCFSCEGQCGSHCATCDAYWCEDHKEEATFCVGGTKYYCDKCMSSGYCEDNPYAVLQQEQNYLFNE